MKEDKKRVYKTSIRKRIQSQYYRSKRLTAQNLSKVIVFDNPKRNNQTNQEDWRKIQRLMENMLMSIKYTIDSVQESEAYKDCLQEKMNEINKFWKQMDSVGYIPMEYVKQYGFHPDFLPEHIFGDRIASVKFVEAVQSFQQYVDSCKAVRNLPTTSPLAQKRMVDKSYTRKTYPKMSDLKVDYGKGKK